MKKVVLLALALMLTVGLVGCDGETSTQRERKQSEMLNQQAISQVGMPSIKNFREKRLLKEILELRDQEGLTTYTYLYSDMTGKLVFLGETIGYGIPYSAQFTNPQRPLTENNSQASVISQPEPNGIYSPDSAEGTWILLKDPNGKDVKPVYVEPRIIVSPFKLNI